MIKCFLIIKNNAVRFLTGFLPKFSILKLFILFGSLFFYSYCYSKEFNKDENPLLILDEIPVLVNVDGYGSFYVNAIYTEKDLLFLNLEELFRILKISCNPGKDENTLSGFTGEEDNIYLIDYNLKQIKFKNRFLNVPEKMIVETGNVYLESSVFSEAFGINITFNYRALAVMLKANFELPVVKQIRLEKMRNGISKINSEIIPDIIEKRNYHLLRLGTMDWSVYSMQSINDNIKNNNSNNLRLGFGSEFLYGETNLFLTYNDKQKFNSRQFHYLWKWVDNDKSIIKQAQLGKISTQSISFLSSPLIGLSVRNSPTTVRKANGYYTIKEYTDPNWSIELYINNVLVDYTKADASGLFTFKVPIVYGYTTLKLMFYGPLGEERTEERILNVPYTIMPKNEFEFGLTAATVTDSKNSRFGKFDFNYGLNHFITIGGGLEYLSSITDNPYTPSLKTTFQPFSKLTLNAEYAHGVQSAGLINWYIKKDALLEVNYTKYVEGQKVSNVNYLEERKIKFSFPFKIKTITVFSKLDYAQFVYNTFNYNQVLLMFSSFIKQFSFNSTTQMNWIDNLNAYYISDLSFSYRFLNGLVFRPSAQFNLNDLKLISYRTVLEKKIANGYLSVSYENNILYKSNFFNINLKFDFPFVRTTAGFTKSNENYNFTEGGQGSFAFDQGKKYFYFNNNASVGKGGISIHPFLDLNQNGIRENNEPKILLNSLRISGGKPIFNEKDSTIRIPDLNPFTYYNLDFNNFDLENISWRFKYSKYRIMIDPNQFKQIDVPIIPMGEVNGMVYLSKDDIANGIGRILIKIYNKKTNELISETLSEPDGYFSYLGLESGKYIALIDSIQLNRLKLSLKTNRIEFEIKSLENGDIVENIVFALKFSANDSTKIMHKIDTMEIHKENLKVIINKTAYIATKPVTKINENLRFFYLNNYSPSISIVKDIAKDTIVLIWGEMCSELGNYFVQCGAFKSKTNAITFAKRIKNQTNMEACVILHKRFYKVQVGCYNKRAEANKSRIILLKVKECINIFIAERRAFVLLNH